MKNFTTSKEIEQLCQAMIKDFLRCKRYTNVHCVDIEGFLIDYLGVSILYETFEQQDRIGFLSDGRQALQVNRDGKSKQIIFPEGTVVLEKALLMPEEIGRKRFTLAHEGAHYILNQHIPIQTTAVFHSDFDGEMTYSTEMLRERLSVNEMFSNRAAAYCLMPDFLVYRNLQRCNNGRKIVMYEGNVLAQDQKLMIQTIADAMGVNYSPLLYRLKQLHLFDVRPIEEHLRKHFRCKGADN